jgi:hypothetical protein
MTAETDRPIVEFEFQPPCPWVDCIFEWQIVEAVDGSFEVAGTVFATPVAGSSKALWHWEVRQYGG